jgi:HAE1 family hydrophobic/amphiphilic exporter-1
LAAAARRGRRRSRRNGRQAIDTARDGYVAVVRRLAPVAIVAVVVVVGVVAASVALFSVTPKSFLPDEDQGAIFAALRLPEGASINAA